jgi:hypothetical protein
MKGESYRLKDKQLTRPTDLSSAARSAPSS